MLHTSPLPSLLGQALARAVAALNTVTVPQGAQRATDSGAASGEGDTGEGDHTLWAVVRDHASRALYWRSARNPSLRRVALDAFDLAPGAPVRVLSVEAGPIATDMGGAFA